MSKIRSVNDERNLLLRQILTATWTCAGLEVLVLFSIWQSLPVIGRPVNAVIVGVVFTFWIFSLVIYRLTLGRRQVAVSRRKQIYQNYLP